VKFVIQLFLSYSTRKIILNKMNIQLTFTDL